MPYASVSQCCVQAQGGVESRCGEDWRVNYDITVDQAIMLSTLSKVTYCKIQLLSSTTTYHSMMQNRLLSDVVHLLFYLLTPQLSLTSSKSLDQFSHNICLV